MVGVLTDPATLGRLDELVQMGFHVADVSSTDNHVVVELTKGRRRTALKLGPDAARELVYGEGPPTSKRIPTRRTP